jgi:hypothetical protein
MGPPGSEISISKLINDPDAQSSQVSGAADRCATDDGKARQRLE